MKKRDNSFAHPTSILLLHYLVKWVVVVWPFITMNSSRVAQESV